MEMGMDMYREARILEDAIKKYGPEHQTIIAIEEMSELTKALVKRLRCREPEDSDAVKRLEADIREEMADVSIMLNQLELIFGETYEEEEAKLERLERLVADDNT